jgi:hypothetical protein
MRNFVMLVGALCVCASVASAGLDIVVSFDDNEYVWTDIEKAVVNHAIADWEAALSGYALDEVVSFGIDHRNEGGAAAVTYGWGWGDPVTRPWLNTGHYMGVLPWSLTWDPTPETDDDVSGYDALNIIRHELGHLLGCQPGLYFDYGEDKWTSEIRGTTFDRNGLNVSMVAGDLGHTNGGLMNPYTYVGDRFGVGLTSQMVAKAFDLEWRGDFDFDRDVSVADIDAMSAALRAGSSDLLFNVNADGVFDATDADALIHDWVRTTLSSFNATTGVWEMLGTEYGDFNLDGEVGLLDLAALGDAYGTSGGWSQGDANGDGVIGLLDLALLGDNYNFSRSAIPEPASSALLLVGIGALLKRRRI